jgi:hypothetical protein
MTNYKNLEVRSYGGYAKGRDFDLRHISLFQFDPLFEFASDENRIPVYGFHISFEECDGALKPFVQMQGMKPDSSGVSGHVNIGVSREVPFDALIRRLAAEIKSRRDKHSSECPATVSPEIAEYLHKIFK